MMWKAAQDKNRLRENARGLRERAVVAVLVSPLFTGVVAVVLSAAVGSVAGVMVHNVTAGEPVDVVLVEDPRDIDGRAHARVRTPGGEVGTARVAGVLERGDTAQVVVDDGEFAGQPVSRTDAAILGGLVGAVFGVTVVTMLADAGLQRWAVRRAHMRVTVSAE